MKAERRHELKHNELADWLGERMEAAKPHATGVLLGIGVLVAMVLASVWYFGGENVAASRAWSQYFDAFNDLEPQKRLQSLATDQAGSKAAWWAMSSVGDMNLAEGTALLYSDRKEAQKKLELAEQAYKQVEAADDPMLKTRARLGLARVYESLFKPADAIKYYEQVAAEEKDSPLGKSATDSVKRLKNSREIAFLNWFATQTPKRPSPFPGMGGGLPGLPNDLPERPNISLPTGLGLDSIGTGAPAEPPPAFPAPAGTTPGATPAETPAPDAPKADDAKPAEPATPDAAKAPSTDAASEKKPE